MARKKSPGVRLPRVAKGVWVKEYQFHGNFFPRPEGGYIHYLDEGSGPPVLLLHGNPTWSFMYRNLVKALAPHYRCLVPDHLGLGLSSRPKKKDYSFRLADRVSDLSALINSLNLTEPVHLVAHDWGGPIGLGWAGANPSLVKSITLMNTGLRIPAGYQPPTSLGIFMTGLWGQFLANRANLFLSGILRYGSVRPIPPGLAEGYLAPYSHSLLRGAIGRFVKDIPLKPSHPSFGALKNADLAFDELVRPTLFIWGLQDFVFTPAFLEDFMARRPEAQVLALPRSGHLLLEDEPDKISAALEDFFTKIPKASGPEVLGHGQ